MKYYFKGDCEKVEIPGKDIYVFGDHATALLPWTEISRYLGQRPILLTLDNHTDIHKAFSRHVSYQHTTSNNESELVRQSHCSAIRCDDFKTIESAIKELENDEQIDAAIKTAIIDFALVIHHAWERATASIEEKAYREQMSDIDYLLDSRREKHAPPKPPFTYEIPASRIFLSTPLDDFDACLESPRLVQNLTELKQMVTTSGLGWIDDKPYILDIDLDFFRSKKSIAPLDTSEFYKLLRNAAAITIALEPLYVERNRDDPDLDSEYLFEKIKEHIQKALSVCNV